MKNMRNRLLNVNLWLSLMLGIISFSSNTISLIAQCVLLVAIIMLTTICYAVMGEQNTYKIIGGYYHGTK